MNQVYLDTGPLTVHMKRIRIRPHFSISRESQLGSLKIFVRAVS